MLPRAPTRSVTPVLRGLVDPPLRLPGAPAPSPWRRGLVACAIVSVVLASSCAATSVREAPPAVEVEAPTSPVSPRPTPPPGFTEFFVAGILMTDEGPAVLLHNEPDDTLLPIAIGETEAITIQTRLDRRRFQRPLTHDLLSEAVEHLGGTFVEARIDGLRDGVFIGVVLLRTSSGVIHLDARPSDGIAIAVGHQLPIFVADEVIERAAVRRSDVFPPPSQRREESQELDL